MEKEILIDKSSGIPLLGLIQIGIIDRGSNLIQIRPTTLCNLKCVYCSTDAGPSSIKHNTAYVAELGYLIETFKAVTAIKGKGIIANIDSVGEPTTYPEIVSLVKSLKEIKEVKEVSMQTNGTLLAKDKIIELEKAGLDKINLSINAIDEKLAKVISGSESYDISKVIDNIKSIAATKIRLWLCPVYIPGLNDDEIPKIIRLAKEVGASLGIQKFEIYKHSRKPKGVKAVNYWKFYKKLSEWEKEFDVKLKFSNNDLGFERRPRLEAVFERNEKAYAIVKCEGWLKGQMIGVTKNRSVTINNCNSKIEDKVRIKILENKNGIYIAEMA